MKKNLFFWLLFSLPPFGLAGQEAILLENPSFEGEPRHSKLPTGWHDCGFAGESPPDLHPSGDFSVTAPAQQGRTYLGMVVRDNSTWEAVGQKLSTPFSPGTCYGFSIFVARSQLYVSASRVTNEPANYDVPTRLLVWAGYAPCERKELLWETVPVPFYDWTRLDMVLKPSAPYTHLILEAYYDGDALFPYNGNLLLDNASPLLPVDCSNPRTTSLKLDELEAPPLASLEALQAFLVEQAKLVQFDGASNTLNQHLFKASDGSIVRTNPNLWLIGRAVAQHPKLKLEFFLPAHLDRAVRFEGGSFMQQSQLMQLYKQGIVDALKTAGLARARYSIVIGDSLQPQRKAPWLLPVRDHVFNLRLRGKLK
jgi:hypothetical protein